MAANQQQTKKNSNGQPPKPSAQTLDEEQQLEQALKHLDFMHKKCRDLRATVPTMIQLLPTHRNAENPMRSFTDSVTTARDEIKGFGALYQGEKSRTILEQARKSREANPKGIKPWRARDHPGWLDNAQ
ncbi:hypothetical protein GGR56DRAFT_628071 [Xylariaceae sp. FL0804]|nr:hypothetical protein GGR56DRAFT_628071 [Xylariaceae sp. FL0804]